MGTNYAECQAGQAFELVDLWQDEWGFLAIANEKIGFSAIGKFKTRWFTLLSSSTPLPEKLALPWIDNFCPHAREEPLWIRSRIEVPTGEVQERMLEGNRFGTIKKPVRSELLQYLLQNYIKLHKNGIKTPQLNLRLIQYLLKMNLLLIQVNSNLKMEQNQINQQLILWQKQAKIYLKP